MRLVSAATLLVAAAACEPAGRLKLEGGYIGTIQAPVDVVWAGVQQSLAKYDIALHRPKWGKRTYFLVDDTEFLVEVKASRSGNGADVFVACNCPWPATRELLEAILDDQEAAGRPVRRPGYAVEPLNPDETILNELRRRRKQ